MNRQPLVLAFVFALLGFVSGTHGETSVILKQNGAPLELSEYTANLRSYDHSDRIRHAVAFRNTSTQSVVAVQIGFASFDTFNVFLGRMDGVAIETLDSGFTAKGTWEQSALTAFTFEKHGTGIAWVNAVRFKDGTIWRCDRAEVLRELQKYERDLKPEDLQERKNANSDK